MPISFSSVTAGVAVLVHVPRSAVAAGEYDRVDPYWIDRVLADHRFDTFLAPVSFFTDEEQRGWCGDRETSPSRKSPSPRR